MTPERTDADVIVVGGGTAGMQAALQLALVGRSVVVLERRPAGRNGARWCNGVLPWQFERAGLARPEPPELRGRGGRTVMVSPDGRHRFAIEDGPIWEADMRHLVARLTARAIAAGVDVRWGVSDVVVELEDGRPMAVTGHHEGVPLRVAARLLVDASGYRGVLRDQVPALATTCPPPAPGDLCSAQQLVLEVDDPEGAKAFLHAHGASPGDSVTTVGLAGGYSTANIQVEASLREVSVLTGSIPSLGNATGPEIVRAIRELHPWMGATIFGGGGLIPLRRAYDRFTAPGIALVGDAACQVMAGHGSGIGFGLIAGKVLAEAVDEATGGAHDPGDPDVLWRYQATYLREFGAVFAAYDAVRHMSVALGQEGIDAMFASGIFSPTLVRPGLEQRLGMLGPTDAARSAVALARHRSVAKVVVPALVSMTAARAVYRAYPLRRSEAAMARWSRLASTVLPAP